MARWQPGTRERLAAAAIQLFVDQGFEPTTVAEIAAAAGLTERTFFRHFADKREVFFAGQDEFEHLFTDAVAAAPPGACPLDVIGAALDAAAAFFPDERRSFSRARQLIIDTDAGLRERELLKLSGLKVALGEALRARGTEELAATLAAESGVTVFHLAFARWITAGEKRSITTIQRNMLAELRALAAPG